MKNYTSSTNLASKNINSLTFWRATLPSLIMTSIRALGKVPTLSIKAAAAHVPVVRQQFLISLHHLLVKVRFR